MEKYGRARQDTAGSVIRRMRFACWINEPTDTLIVYHTYDFSIATMVLRKRLCGKLTRTLPVLLILILMVHTVSIPKSLKGTLKQFFVLSYLTKTYEVGVTSVIILYSTFLRTDWERFLLLKCDYVAR